MKITLDRETMSDELYNALLMEFVTAARLGGYPVDRFTRFENWVITCDVDPES